MNGPIRGLAALALALVASQAPAAERARPAPATPQPAATAAAPDAAEIVRRANAALNGIAFLASDFTQTTADGRTMTGRLYLSRPGRIRFDYDPPAATEVVADGTNVVVRDRRLGTSDVYPISQTPLRFLLKGDINLARDVKLIGANAGPEGSTLTFESSSTFVGTSKVSITVDPTGGRLLGWRVLDAQGRQTLVVLGEPDRTPIQDARLFDVNFQSMR